jgi:hypothetical protein
VSRTRVIRLSVDDNTDPNVSASSTSQSGGGASWSSNRVNLTNSNSSSKTLTYFFSRDFRTADATYNIPADRCIVRYKARPFIDISIISGGLGVIFDITYTSSSGTQNFSSFTDSNFGLTDYLQTGSAVTTQTAGLNPLDGSSTYIGVQVDTSNSNSNGLHDITLNIPQALVKANTGPAGSLVRSWEADDIVIDANDPVVFSPPTFTMDVLGGLVKQGQSSQTSSAAITSDDKVIKFAQADLTHTASITADAKNNINANSSLTTDFEFLSTTENFVLMDALNLSTASTSVIDGKLTFIETFNLTAPFTAQQTAGLIYDITGDYTWDTFNLNTYFEVGYTEDNFALNEGEYTWNFLADSDWDSWPIATWIGDEETWDNWPDDVWEKPYIVGSAASMIISPAFKLGDVVSYTGTFTIDENSAFEKASSATFTTAFTTSFTASGVIDVDADLTGTFAPALTANITYDLQDNEVTITGAFTPVLTASAITDTFADIDVTASISITPTFKPAGESAISAATELDLSPTFKPAGLAALTALASTLQVGRLFFPADPYNTIKVPQENRVVLVPVENKQTLVMEENRVNIVGAENRAYEVPQETRRIKLRIPPYSNRFSTPRVRSSQ